MEGYNSTPILAPQADNTPQLGPGMGCDLLPMGRGGTARQEGGVQVRNTDSNQKGVLGSVPAGSASSSGGGGSYSPGTFEPGMEPGELTVGGGRVGGHIREGGGSGFTDSRDATQGAGQAGYEAAGFEREEVTDLLTLLGVGGGGSRCLL